MERCKMYFKTGEKTFHPLFMSSTHIDCIQLLTCAWSITKLKNKSLVT